MERGIRIYSEFQSPRLSYVLDTIFIDLLGIDYTLVTDQDNAHLNYSMTELNLDIAPYGLLQEKGIRNLKDEVKFEPWENSWCCFKTNGSIPFDVFSATFFLLSRYEEYLEYYLDEHQRFTARESILTQHDLLEQPLINQWALQLKTLLENQYTELSFKPRSFEYISTIDIDQAFKYRNKGIKRNLAGFIRDAVEAKWENFKERWPVLLGIRPDPFNNFDWQYQLHKKEKTRLKYFVLLGDLDTYDKNVNWKNRAFQSLVNSLLSRPGNQVGIHPSYAAGMQLYRDESNKLQAEIKRLNHISGADVTLSRQHFLIHQFPTTYDALLRLGITEEHSMGYSTHLGFRAGIAAPFYYYNFKEECKTDLTLYPFCFMDITPLHYMELNPDQAIVKMKDFMQRVKDVGGLFVSLWHNESLGETEKWKNWRVLYEKMLAQANKV